MIFAAASLCLFAASSASAFVVKAINNNNKRNVMMLRVSKDLSFNPAEGYRSVDADRAKFCAENFNACSVDEMEDIRENLHKERMQNFVFGEQGIATMSQEAMEHLVLEEELELQLGLLSDITPSPTLFPEVEDEMEELPHLKDDTVSHAVEDSIHRVENMVAYQETILEESTLETLAICMVVLSLAFAPSVLDMMN